MGSPEKFRGVLRVGCPKGGGLRVPRSSQLRLPARAPEVLLGWAGAAHREAGICSASWPAAPPARVQAALRAGRGLRSPRRERQQ